MTIFCSQEALAINAPIYGTASEAQVWIMLEYAGLWTEKALDDNQLPEYAQTWLATQAAAVPNSRAVFIKQPGRQSTHTTLYIAILQDGEERLYHFNLANYDQLGYFDVAKMIETDPKMVEMHLAEHPLYLVCTNGKRDQCCTKFGLPIYDGLKAAEQVVWQCTHLGGHRYAPAIATFPAGVMYGFVQPGDVSRIMQPEIALDLYRGRVFQNGVRNAADYFLRRHLSIMEADGVRVVAADSTLPESQMWSPDNLHTVTFDSGHVVSLTATETEPVLVGCTKNKMKPQLQYDLVEIIENGTHDVASNLAKV